MSKTLQKIVTLEMLKEWGACHMPVREAYFAGRAYVTAQEVASDESLTFSERLWVLVRLLTPEAREEFLEFLSRAAENACGQATDCARNISNPLNFKKPPVHAEEAVREAARVSAYHIVAYFLDRVGVAQLFFSGSPVYQEIQSLSHEASVQAARAVQAAAALAPEWANGFEQDMVFYQERKKWLEGWTENLLNEEFFQEGCE